MGFISSPKSMSFENPSPNSLKKLTIYIFLRFFYYKFSFGFACLDEIFTFIYDFLHMIICKCINY